MITPDELQEMILEGMPAAMLREKLAGGLRQETAEERSEVWRVLKAMLGGENVDAFRAVLDATCKELIVPSNRKFDSLLYSSVRAGSSEAVMALVERMRKDNLRETDVAVFTTMLSRQCEKEVEDAVLSVLDPIVFGVAPAVKDLLYYAVSCPDETRAARAVDIALKHGPTMEERLEAGIERFRYVIAAAGTGHLDTLQKMHDLLPLLPDGSGRRGELADYARAIGMATHIRPVSETAVISMLEYLAEQAGDEEVFDHCSPMTLLSCEMTSVVKWLVERAPQLVEVACKQPSCALMLVGPPEKAKYLIEKMVDLVEPKVLCDMMRMLAPLGWRVPGWRSGLKPVHEAVPESMDGLRWIWLVDAIEEKLYGDVKYMLGMCTREHLTMRDEWGDTAYDIAVMDEEFPPDLLERLKAVPMAKRAHARGDRWTVTSTTCDGR